MRKIKDSYVRMRSFSVCDLSLYSSNAFLIELRFDETCRHLGFDRNDDDIYLTTSEDGYISNVDSQYIGRIK